MANINISDNIYEFKQNGEFDLLFQNWQTVSTGDSQWFLDNAFKTDGSGNYGKYSNKKLDDLINKLATTFDVKEREKITKEASQIIIDEGYGTYIVSQANVNVSNNKVENMHNFPIDYYFLTVDTKIKKQESDFMNTLLEIIKFNINYKNSIKAVKDVNFTLEDNQIISIVGESGSGKSTLIRAILKLLPMGGEIESGNIFFLGKDILSLNKNELNSLRGKDIGMIFQDPNSTMDPIKTIEKQFIEYILEHNDMPKKEAIELAKEYLLKLNLTDVNRVLKSYPFELSGGMKQRVAIAMAMAQSPRLLLADEPTSALDVTVQAQVIKELKRIRENFKTAIILVTHNMGVASYISDKIAVMKNGEIIEFGDKEQIIKNPQKEYTKSLLNAIINLKQESRESL